MYLYTYIYIHTHVFTYEYTHIHINVHPYKTFFFCCEDSSLRRVWGLGSRVQWLGGRRSQDRVWGQGLGRRVLAVYVLKMLMSDFKGQLCLCQWQQELYKHILNMHDIGDSGPG